jgi:hypothetical protein
MTTSPLDVLMIESDPGIGSGPAADLLEAGHRVHWCHDATDHGFRCGGLQEPSTCPLEAHVDVAFVAREGLNPRPTDLEAGVRCAIRAHVPVVEQGTEVLDPYAPWVAERIVRGEDPVAACERAAHHAHEALERGIRSRIAGLLSASSIPADAVGCRFRVSGQALAIELVLPVEVSKRMTHALAVRVLDAVRSDERTYGRVNVQTTTEAAGLEPDGAEGVRRPTDGGGQVRV